MKKCTLLVLFLAIFTSCSATKNNNKIERDYDDIEKTITWSEIFKLDLDEYYVYFYSKTCGHCKELKPMILDYYFSTDEELYFSEANEETVYGKKSDLYGIENIDDFYIFGTPFLIKIKEKVLVEYYSGVSEIREYINYKTKKNYN